MEYYRGEYNYRSAGTLLGIAATIILAAVLLGIAYNSFHVDFVFDKTPRIVGCCVALIAVVLIAVAIGNSISFFSRRQLSIIISSAGIKQGSSFTPWEQVSSLFGIESLNGVFIGFTLKEKYRSVQLICTTPPLTQTEFTNLMENLSSSISSNYPSVRLESIYAKLAVELPN